MFRSANHGLSFPNGLNELTQQARHVGKIRNVGLFDLAKSLGQYAVRFRVGHRGTKEPLDERPRQKYLRLLEHIFAELETDFLQHPVNKRRAVQEARGC